MDEVSGLDRVVDGLRSEIVAVVRSAATRAGKLVAGFDVSYDEAADALEELARPLGADAMDAVLAGLDAGMAGGVTEDVSGELTDAPPPPEPPAPPEATEGPFSDWDEVSAAVVGWAGRWLRAGPGSRVSSAELAAHWAEHVGRPLTRYHRNVSDAVVVWAEVSGVEVSRYRTGAGRGLRGLALVTPGEPPAVDVTLPGPEAVTLIDDPTPDVTRPVAEPVRRRPPNGGTWQSYADLGDAVVAGTDDWFET